MIFAGLDIETTGVDVLKGHRIIEVGVQVRTEEGRTSIAWTQRINPGRSIDPGAEETHGISLADLVHEPPWEKVAPTLVAILQRCDYVVAHNGEAFDMPFIYHELIRVGIAPPRVRLIDTMLQGRWATPDGSVPTLERLAWACRVEYDKEKAHGALYDTGVMLDCFFKQYPRGFFQLPTREFAMPDSKEAA